MPEDTDQTDAPVEQFSTFERESFYRLIGTRRDIRHFRAHEVPEDVLSRILQAGHAAPSVGHSQPWRFITVRDRSTRQAIHDSFVRVNQLQQELVDEDRAELYRSLKLEGILDAPLNLAVVCERVARQPHSSFTLGHSPQPTTDLLSTCLAVQNIWLAARVEGVGVGWVSLVEPDLLRQLLHLPDHVELVAYLCLGYPVEFYRKPMLELAGWKEKVPLNQVCLQEHWTEH
jgi:5,6-dimethylbenzimidazole synthase